MANGEYNSNLCEEFQDTTSRQRSQSDSGLECEFVGQPLRRSQCPICLLVPRDPHQTPCCGNAFCGACITKVKEKNQPCPTCKKSKFSSYPDKGLQQELYSSIVYCTYKSEGCDWEGELRNLEQHFETEQEKPETTRNGCKFVPVQCLHCKESYPRGKIHRHQESDCGRRPFICQICREYESTYDDVMSLHQSSCKCRPVDCPNKCGLVVQYQKLEEHLSSECELSEVKCEFSHAGCEVKMLRRDLPSHMTNNMATHLSLLARENRQLKCLVDNQSEALRQLKAEIVQLQQVIHEDKHEVINCFSKQKEFYDRDRQEMISSFTRLPPLYISYPWKKYAYWTTLFCIVTDENDWFSEPFYSHYGGYKLRLKVRCVRGTLLNANAVYAVYIAYEYMESEAASNVTLFIQTAVLDQESGLHHIQKILKVTPSSSDLLKINDFQINKCIKKGSTHTAILVENVMVDRATL